MDLSKALEGIEKLFLEILGYLLPGVALLYLTSFCLRETTLTLPFDVATMNEWLLVALAYLLGYLVYGVALVRDTLYESAVLRLWSKIRKKEIKSDRLAVFDRVNESFEIEVSRRILSDLLAHVVPDVPDRIEKMNVQGVRNLAMSYVPQSDRKVYTFMFRADLCDHLSVVALVLGAWGILSCVSGSVFGMQLILSTKDSFLYSYLLLIVATYFLHKTRIRFLGISMSIPFSMFIAEYHKLEGKNG